MRRVAVLLALMATGLAGTSAAGALWAASATGSASAGAATMTNATAFTAACSTTGNGRAVVLNWTISPDVFVDEYEIVRTGTGGGTSATYRVPRTTATLTDEPVARDGYTYAYTIRALSTTSAWTTTTLAADVVITYVRTKCSTA